MITSLERRAIRRAPVSQMVNVSWAFTGNLVYALSQLAILICLSRYVSTEIVGYYAFAAACTNPIIAFFNLQLRSYQATDARSEYDFNTYFTLRIFMMGFGAIVALFVCSFIGADPLLASIVLLLMLRKALDSVSDVLYGFFQQRGRMDCIAKSLMATGIASLVGLAIAVMRTGSLETGLAVSAAVTAAILLGYTVPACLRLRRDPLMTAPPTVRTLTSLTRTTPRSCCHLQRASRPISSATRSAPAHSASSRSSGTPPPSAPRRSPR
jgi:O-antigen/teichoic acid export membrane protein